MKNNPPLESQESKSMKYWRDIRRCEAFLSLYLSAIREKFPHSSCIDEKDILSPVQIGVIVSQQFEDMEDIQKIEEWIRDPETIKEFIQKIELLELKKIEFFPCVDACPFFTIIKTDPESQIQIRFVMGTIIGVPGIKAFVDCTLKNNEN